MGRVGSNLLVQLNALGDSDKLLSVRPRVEAGAPHWNARMHPYLNHEHARSDGTLSSILGKPWRLPTLF